MEMQNNNHETIIANSELCGRPAISTLYYKPIKCI